tara:strand:+ start:21029 stop:21538 length:510 start_codon:yes stop_codon:yes gene_type:complete
MTKARDNSKFGSFAGNEVFLDSDKDTSITADTDDQIDFKVGGTDRVVIDSSGNLTATSFIGDGSSLTGIVGGTDWKTVKTSNFTAVAAEGYFIDTTSSAITLTLPASPSLGDEVVFKDYAGTFDTNNLTIGRNGSNIEGSAADLTVSVEGAGNTLVYVDSTKGWLIKNK